MLTVSSATPSYLQSAWNLAAQVGLFILQSGKQVLVSAKEAFRGDNTWEDRLWAFSYLPRKPAELALEIQIRADQGLSKFVGRIQPLSHLPMPGGSMSQLSTHTIVRLRHIFNTVLNAAKVRPAEMADEMGLFFQQARAFSERLTAFHHQEMDEEQKNKAWELANPICQYISDLENDMLTLQGNISRYASSTTIVFQLQLMQREIARAWRQGNAPNIADLNQALRVLDGVWAPTCESPKKLEQMIQEISGSVTDEALEKALNQVQHLASIYNQVAKENLENIELTSL